MHASRRRPASSRPGRKHARRGTNGSVTGTAPGAASVGNTLSATQQQAVVLDLAEVMLHGTSLQDSVAAAKHGSAAPQAYKNPWAAGSKPSKRGRVHKPSKFGTTSIAKPRSAATAAAMAAAVVTGTATPAAHTNGDKGECLFSPPPNPEFLDVSSASEESVYTTSSPKPVLDTSSFSVPRGRRNIEVFPSPRQPRSARTTMYRGMPTSPTRHVPRSPSPVLGPQGRGGSSMYKTKPMQQNAQSTGTLPMRVELPGGYVKHSDAKSPRSILPGHRHIPQPGRTLTQRRVAPPSAGLPVNRVGRAGVQATPQPKRAATMPSTSTAGRAVAATPHASMVVQRAENPGSMLLGRITPSDALLDSPPRERRPGTSPLPERPWSGGPSEAGTSAPARRDWPPAGSNQCTTPSGHPTRSMSETALVQAAADAESSDERQLPTDTQGVEMPEWMQRVKAVSDGIRVRPDTPLTHNLRSFYYPSVSESPQGFVLVNEGGDRVCRVRAVEADGSTRSAASGLGGLARAMFQLPRSRHHANEEGAMVLPAQFYSDTAILKRESNRLHPAVQRQCTRMWQKLVRWFGIHDSETRGLSKAAYEIVFAEYARLISAASQVVRVATAVANGESLVDGHLAVATPTHDATHMDSGHSRAQARRRKSKKRVASQLATLDKPSEVWLPTPDRAKSRRALKAALAEDWAHDSQGCATLDKRRFSLAYYQIADVWTDYSMDPTVYADVLASLYDSLSTNPSMARILSAAAAAGLLRPEWEVDASSPEPESQTTPHRGSAKRKPRKRALKLSKPAAATATTAAAESAGGEDSKHRASGAGSETTAATTRRKAARRKSRKPKLGRAKSGKAKSRKAGTTVKTHEANATVSAKQEADSPAEASNRVAPVAPDAAVSEGNAAHKRTTHASDGSGASDGGESSDARVAVAAQAGEQVPRVDLGAEPDAAAAVAPSAAAHKGAPQSTASLPRGHPTAPTSPIQTKGNSGVMSPAHTPVRTLGSGDVQRDRPSTLSMIAAAYGSSDSEDSTAAVGSELRRVRSQDSLLHQPATNCGGDVATRAPGAAAAPSDRRGPRAAAVAVKSAKPFTRPVLPSYPQQSPPPSSRAPSPREPTVLVPAPAVRAEDVLELPLANLGMHNRHKAPNAAIAYLEQQAQKRWDAQRMAEARRGRRDTDAGEDDAPDGSLHSARAHGEQRGGPSGGGDAGAGAVAGSTCTVNELSRGDEAPVARPRQFSITLDDYGSILVVAPDSPYRGKAQRQSERSHGQRRSDDPINSHVSTSGVVEGTGEATVGANAASRRRHAQTRASGGRRSPRLRRGDPDTVRAGSPRRQVGARVVSVNARGTGAESEHGDGAMRVAIANCLLPQRVAGLDYYEGGHGGGNFAGDAVMPWHERHFRGHVRGMATSRLVIPVGRGSTGAQSARSYAAAGTLDDAATVRSQARSDGPENALSIEHSHAVAAPARSRASSVSSQPPATSSQSEAVNVALNALLLPVTNVEPVHDARPRTGDQGVGDDGVKPGVADTELPSPRMIPVSGHDDPAASYNLLPQRSDSDAESRRSLAGETDDTEEVRAAMRPHSVPTYSAPSPRLSSHHGRKVGRASTAQGPRRSSKADGAVARARNRLAWFRAAYAPTPQQSSIGGRVSRPGRLLSAGATRPQRANQLSLGGTPRGLPSAPNHDSVSADVRLHGHGPMLSLLHGHDIDVQQLELEPGKGAQESMHSLLSAANHFEDAEGCRLSGESPLVVLLKDLGTRCVSHANASRVEHRVGVPRRPASAVPSSRRLNPGAQPLQASDDNPISSWSSATSAAKLNAAMAQALDGAVPAIPRRPRSALHRRRYDHRRRKRVRLATGWNGHSEPQDQHASGETRVEGGG